jgi:hypothetical protein
VTKDTDHEVPTPDKVHIALEDEVPDTEEVDTREEKAVQLMRKNFTIGGYLKL